MCLILNQQNIKRFQEEIYCLPPDIVVRCTSIKPWNMAIGNHPDDEFLQPKTKKPFRIFAPVCYFDHWWLWVADVRKIKFYILDPYHKTCPSEVRMKLNKFVRYVISRIRAENVKRGKYECDNWTQDEVDHYRVEYASWILFHEMNQDKVEVIRRSDAIRLSKPSSVLLSPYCQIDSYDIDTN
ncbi:hypothetical protein Ahy_A07g033554 [Arachis hypogaea]|uniref:Ubiquitin-like protease family profile domain-containing protein n=1 Tax=Arachis hypogaea TaxID=3818 RepID=A0A445C9U9_ARAHY|nr:hypothetical protein Ahy_A07g033554 [Arachis hypogaea]